MKITMIKLLLLLVFPATLLQGQAKNWKLFQSYEGAFKIEIPNGQMEEQEQVISTDIGEITYHTYFYQEGQKDFENALYVVSYCDYPAYSVHSDSTAILEDFFNNTITSAEESVIGELRYAEDINYKDYPGKLFRIDYREGTATLKSKIFVAKNRFYNIQIATTRGKSLNVAADRFLDSFHILTEYVKENKF